MGDQVEVDLAASVLRNDRLDRVHVENVPVVNDLKNDRLAKAGLVMNVPRNDHLVAVGRSVDPSMQSPRADFDGTTGEAIGAMSGLVKAVVRNDELKDPQRAVVTSVATSGEPRNASFRAVTLHVRS